MEGLCEICRYDFLTCKAKIGKDICFDKKFNVIYCDCAKPIEKDFEDASEELRKAVYQCKLEFSRAIKIAGERLQRFMRRG